MSIQESPTELAAEENAGTNLHTIEQPQYLSFDKELFPNLAAC